VKKRLVISGLLGALVALLLVPSAGAAIPRDTSSVIASFPSATWLIKVKGVGIKELSYRGFAAIKATKGVSWTDTVSGDIYGGVDLKTLVGLVDDKHPATFNTKRATLGAGYMVRVTAVDGFYADFASADVATKNIVVASRLTPSGGTEAALPCGTAKYKTASDSVGFSPAWPLKLVGSDLTSGKQKVGGIVRIQIMPAPTGP